MMKFKPICCILMSSILTFLLCSCSFIKISAPSNINESEEKLINYILENGKNINEGECFSISDNTIESGFSFTTTIEYNTSTQKITFKDTSYISGAFTSAYMYYEYGANEQKVEIKMSINPNSANKRSTISSKGIIYPATYTRLNQTIYSFESSYDHNKLQPICETAVYQMLTHCQLLMLNAQTGLVPFGFEKGIL